MPVSAAASRSGMDANSASPVTLKVAHSQRAVGSTTNTVPVRYKGITPDIFGDEVDVIVEGEWRADGIFYASNVIAQHPPEFKVAEPGKPHEPVSDADRAPTQ